MRKIFSGSNRPPIPDRQFVGLTTERRRDPATHFLRSKSFALPKKEYQTSTSCIHDVGFGASSAFGGPCNTPTAERLSNSGFQYSRFHTTALCSPTTMARSPEETITPQVWVQLRKWQLLRRGDLCLSKEHGADNRSA